MLSHHFHVFIYHNLQFHIWMTKILSFAILFYNNNNNNNNHLMALQTTQGQVLQNYCWHHLHLSADEGERSSSQLMGDV